jgi:hypothetical protein
VKLTSNLLKTAVRIRLDFPVRLSPATTMRTPVKRRELMELDEAFSMVTTNPRIKMRAKTSEGVSVEN